LAFPAWYIHLATVMCEWRQHLSNSTIARLQLYYTKGTVFSCKGMEWHNYKEVQQFSLILFDQTKFIYIVTVL